MKTLVKIVAFVALSIGVLFVCPILVGFNYIRWIENSPLNNPVSIDRIDDKSLHLSDGRTIQRLEWRDDHGPLPQAGDMIELEPLGGNDVVIVMKSQVFICGTSAPCIKIPLIPVDVRRYQRRAAGFGELSE